MRTGDAVHSYSTLSRGMWRRFHDPDACVVLVVLLVPLVLRWNMSNGRKAGGTESRSSLLEREEVEVVVVLVLVAWGTKERERARTQSV